MKPQEQDTWPGFVHPPHSSCTKHLTTTRAPGAGRFVLGLDSERAQPRVVAGSAGCGSVSKAPRDKQGTQLLLPVLCCSISWPHC